jgi:hypothetical protein
MTARTFLSTLLSATFSVFAVAQPAPPTGAATDPLATAAVVASAKLTPSQRSIVRGLPKDSLVTLLGEWGEDIQKQFSLDARDGGAQNAARLCKRPCTADEATLLVMEAAWERLRK